MQIRAIALQFDLLHPRATKCEILIQSNNSKSGFGLRRLSLGELGSLFRLPTLMHQYLHHDIMFNFPPVQILNWLLDCGLCEQSPQKRRRQTMQLVSPTPIQGDAPTFLPTIGRILPGTWAKIDEISHQFLPGRRRPGSGRLAPSTK